MEKQASAVPNDSSSRHEVEVAEVVGGASDVIVAVDITPAPLGYQTELF